MIPRDYFTSTFKETASSTTVATCTVDVSADAPSWAKYAVVTWLVSSTSGTHDQAVLAQNSINRFVSLTDPVQISNLFIVLLVADGDITWAMQGDTQVRCQMGGFWF